MRVWILGVFLLACSGPSDKGAKEPKPVAPAPEADAGVATETPQPATAVTLTEEECVGFFSKVFDMAAEAQRKNLAPEEQPTAEDVAKAKAAKRDEMVPQCMKLTKEQLNYDCFMAAADLQALAACEKG